MANLKDENKINALQSLKETQGWKVIVEVLEANIKDTEEKMFADDIKDISQMKILNSKRKDRMELRNLPNTLIEIYKKKEANPPEFDAYG